MYKRRKKLGAVVCAALLGAMTLTACGNASEAANAIASEANIIELEASGFTGTVTAVNGNEITLTVSTGMAGMGNMQMGQMPSGDMSMPDGNSMTIDPNSGSSDSDSMMIVPDSDSSANGAADGSAADGSASEGNPSDSSTSDNSSAPSGSGVTGDVGTAADGTNGQPQEPPTGTPGSTDPGAQGAGGQGGTDPGAQAAGGQGGTDPGAQAAGGQGGTDPGAQAAGNQGGTDPGAQATGNQGGTDPGAQAAGDQTAEAPEGWEETSDSTESTDNTDQAAAGSENGAGNAVDGTESTETTESMEDAQLSDTITVVITINDTSVLTDADGNAAEVSDIAEGDQLTITLNDSGEIESIQIGSGDDQLTMPGGDMGSGNGAAGGAGGNAMGAGGMGGQTSGIDSYTAVNEFSEDQEISGESYTSDGTDENAILVSGGNVKLNGITVDRTSSDSTGGDNSSFYGVGAAVLTTDGTAYISDSTITTDAAGGAGVFAYGEGTVYVSNTTITTSQDTSGGIHAAGGGTLYAWDCTVNTSGESSAAIRSDRGGGTMVIDGGSYTSTGTGSPAIYCTADIAVNNAQLTASGSEAICIEGKNSLYLYDCSLVGNMSDNEQNDCTWNVIVYQSMSGDSEVGNGTFSMIGGNLIANNGGMFYTTNTDSTIYLSGVNITYASENDFFLKCTGNSNARGWGSTGSNGADCNFTADNQEMKGDVIYDSISNLDFYMENGSTLTGAIRDDETNAGNGGSGACNVYIDSSSTWTVTADSTVTNLYNEGTIVDESGKTVTIQGTDGTVYVKGSSSLTVTVSSYTESADFSGASAATDFSDYSE